MMATKGRPRGFDTDEVLDLITRAFWSHGYEATSVADLTKITGVNPPSLYAAFGDKRDIFFAAVRHYMQRYPALSLDMLDQEPTARDGVERMLRAAVVK